MAEKYDPVPDLAWLLDSALVFNGTDAYAAARGIAERLGISEDDRDGAAERALREALGEPAAVADLIIPWGDVQPGDLVLDDGSLVLVKTIDVLPQEGYPDFLIAYVAGWRADDDGNPGRPTYTSPPAAPLTAVRRAGRREVPPC